MIGRWWYAGFGGGGVPRRFGVWKWAQRRLAFQVLMLPGHAGEVNSLAFSPDGKRIVTADKIVKIWDAAILDQVISFVGVRFSAVTCRGCLAGISCMCFVATVLKRGWGCRSSRRRGTRLR